MLFRLQHKPATRFIAFHDVLPEALDIFRANLNFLKAKTNVVSFDDFFLKKLSLKKINVVITFDDGYKGWVSHALPVLTEMGLPATFFVSSGFVGLSKTQETEYMRTKLFTKLGPRKTTGGLSHEDLRLIVEKGFTVGGHTINHFDLSDVRNGAQLRYEIVEDKIRLERLTGARIEYFAYPSGAYRNPEIDIADVLSASGYKGAVTAVSGFNNVESNPFLLHRDLAGSSMLPKVFRAKVYGNFDPVQLLKLLYQR